jgi:hypothetical protein
MLARRLLGWLAPLVLAAPLLSGCGGAAPPPSADSRTEEEKASDDRLIKSRDAYNKGVGR